ncbi:phage virion morphogenesis protein [Mucilaginibacter glaciei]|uniref:Phage virion morphogenesis protein n=1 Tax=Mucilaginibacter glaciei TaxID=2772109 RepID=A0A926NYK7_9SPHI|nr:phage virion morphogenesis protein [Mucilaginibacter glaciei]MBD1394273.1 phage virion morphogenesis protein [Mucilaginibacter glaciei]
MSEQQGALAFGVIRARLAAVVQQLPLILGNEAVNYSLDAFRKQAWEGKPWQARKSKKDTSRSILVKSGRGRRSIRIISTTANSVTIGSDVGYMAVHNNGGEISRAARSETFVRNRFVKGTKKGKFKKGTTDGQGMSFKAYSYRMPQRQFIGHTAAFEYQMKQVVRRELIKAFKGFRK